MGGLQNTLDQSVSGLHTPVEPLKGEWSPCLNTDCLNNNDQQNFELPEGFPDWLPTNQDVDDFSQFPEGFTEWLGANSMGIPPFPDRRPENLEPCGGSDCPPTDDLPCQLPSCTDSQFPPIGDVIGGTEPFTGQVSNGCGTSDPNCLETHVECVDNSCYGNDLGCQNGGCSQNPLPPVSSSIFMQRLRSQEGNCNSQPDGMMDALSGRRNLHNRQMSQGSDRGPDSPYSYSEAKALLMSDTGANQNSNRRKTYHDSIRKIIDYLGKIREITDHLDERVTGYRGNRRKNGNQDNKKTNLRTYNKVIHHTEQDRSSQSRTENFEKANKKHTQTLASGMQTEIDRSRQNTGEERMLADACRDDLCIERVLDLENTDNEVCPPGHHKTVVDGVASCRPMEAGTAGHSDTIQCPEGQRLLETSTGHICEKLIQHGACPEGFTSTEVNGETKCIENDRSEERHGCPRGQILFHTQGGSVCHFPKDIPVLCHLTEQAVDTVTGFVCVEIAVDIPTCVNKAQLSRTADGFECVEVPCPAGSQKMEKGDNFVCVAMAAKEIQCPAGHTFVDTADGNICQPVPTETPACPDGLTQVETPVGILCQFKASVHTEDLLCQNGERLIINADGHKCEKPSPSSLTNLPPRSLIKPSSRSLSKESCPEGQILIKTDEGARCGFTTDRLDTQETPPCPPGLVAKETEDGVKCKYRSTETMRGYSSCPIYEILTQTKTGFLCRSVLEDQAAEADLHECSRNQQLVQTEAALECVDVTESLLMCSHGMELVRANGKFSCKEVNDEMKCAPNEVLVVDEVGSRCLSQGDRAGLCGEGHRLVSTPEGPVCRALKMKLDCPEGFVMVQKMNGIQCVSTKGKEGLAVEGQGHQLQFWEELAFSILYEDKEINFRCFFCY